MCISENFSPAIIFCATGTRLNALLWFSSAGLLHVNGIPWHLLKSTYRLSLISFFPAKQLLRRPVLLECEYHRVGYLISPVDAYIYFKCVARLSANSQHYTVFKNENTYFVRCICCGEIVLSVIAAIDKLFSICLILLQRLGNLLRFSKHHENLEVFKLSSILRGRALRNSFD